MPYVWTGFAVFVALLLFLDLFVLNKHDHVPRTREALGQTALWMAIGLGFSGFIYLAYTNGWVISDLPPHTGHDQLPDGLPGGVVAEYG